MLLGHSALEAEIWGLSGKIPPSHFSCYSGKEGRNINSCLPSTVYTVFFLWPATDI